MRFSLHLIRSGRKCLRALRFALPIASVLAAAACTGSAVNAPAIHRPGPALYGYYTTYRPSDLALGRSGVGGAPEATSARTPVDIEAYLKPAVAAGRPAPARLAVRPKISKAPVVASVAAEIPATTAALPSRDAERYAAREQRAGKQMQYRGGDAIVISASALIIILLVIILILLLT